jgi:TPR repeat protein
MPYFMRLLYTIILFFLSFVIGYSQSKISTDFYGKENIRAELCEQSKSFMSEQDVESLISTILSMQGLNNRFVILACTSVDNCIATIDKNNRPVILYNPNFLKSVKKLGFKEADIPSILEKDWSTLTILAHEIGHHLNNHITNPLPGATEIQLELEADKTAGFLVYLMGGTLEKAKMAFQGVSETGDYTHPKRQDRIAALTNGYDDAKNKFPKIIKTIVTNPGSSKSEIEQEIQRAINLYDNKNYTEAFVLFKKNDGNPQTWNYLGRMYLSGFGVTQDYYESVRWYRKSADQGDAKGLNNLGAAYQSGRGLAQDYYESVRLYRKSADQGNAKGQLLLGLMYENGRGVTQDYYESVRWYRKSADQGDALAQYNLGLMYANGRGVTQDYYESVRWYRKSADQGEDFAQNNLGIMYDNGYGVTQDYYEAVRWFRKSAEQGNISGQFNLGKMYESGKGVSVNLIQAKIWYQKAAVNGNEYAKKACTRLGISW